jgi:hypothetical protein
VTIWGLCSGLDGAVVTRSPIVVIGNDVSRVDQLAAEVSQIPGEVGIV